MKKVLILAYDFPPYTSVGAQRPYSWYKYFKRLDIYPVVITRHQSEQIQNPIDYIRPSREKTTQVHEDENGTIIRFPYKPDMKDRMILKYGFRFGSFRKIVTFVFSFLKFLSLMFDNTSSYYHEAKKWIEKNDCDLIIATGEPFILFRYAYLLSKKYKKPWIADYRDGWTTDRTRLRDGLNNVLRQYYQYFEKKYLKRVLFCSFATRDIAELHNKTYSFTQNVVIYNGYIPHEYKKADKNNDVFQIGYSGKVLFFQPIEIFLDGLKLFTSNNPHKKIELIIYGGEFYQEAKNRILKHAPELKNIIRFTKRMKHNELYAHLASNDIGLVLADESRPAIPVKFFDYVYLKKDIIMLKDDKNELSEIVKNLKQGIICNNANDVEKAISHYTKATVEQKKLNEDKIKFYSRKNQAEQMANIIHQNT
jgi:glycosyltransferase involved in cell wall biosynthesis